MTEATTEVGSFIDGTATGRSAEHPVRIHEPATGVLLATLHPADAEQLDRAVEAARAAMSGTWGRTGPADRSRLLHDLAAALASEPGLAELEARNVGKAISSVRAEVGQAVRTLRFYGSVAGAIAGRSTALTSSMLAYALREPVGVCAQIVPWNYPLMMAVWKLAPALAAGCAVVLKPDPRTPLTALRLAELAGEVGVPPGVVNVLPGDGPGLGARLVAHPGVDKVAFTGSTRTGSQIMRASADPIKRLSLELGGKSPNIVFADCDLDVAVPASVWSIFTCAGQSCEARSLILVQEGVYEEFVERFVARAGRLRVGDPLDADTEVGSLISRDHRELVHGFVDDARADGARVRLGGTIPGGPGAFYPPTVVTADDPGLRIGRDEVFGPVATVVPFTDDADAVRQANGVRYGLMATVWTADPARAHRMASVIKAGTVGLNLPYTSFPGVAFGGYKQSGFGRELSIETLDLYLEQKSVLTWTGTRSASPLPR